jgi:hypothetical protein
MTFEATADNETALYRRYATIYSCAARWAARSVQPRLQNRIEFTVAVGGTH